MQTEKSVYENAAGAQSYLDFLASNDGKTFKQVLWQAVSERLNGKKNLSILDAGCGPGWLSKLLSNEGHKVEACDISPTLIANARASYPEIDFQIADLTKRLPYADASFDCVVLSLSALELKDQRAAFLEIRRVLKALGVLVIITVNPYYGYPVGVWKRGILGRLFLRKPKLKLRPYFNFQKKSDRTFVWNKNLVSYFYTLPEQINCLLGLNFSLKHLADIESASQTNQYSLDYRLGKFPIFILLEFEKT